VALVSIAGVAGEEAFAMSSSVNWVRKSGTPLSISSSVACKAEADDAIA
jgi:hypothetical protein